MYTLLQSILEYFHHSHKETPYSLVPPTHSSWQMLIYFLSLWNHTICRTWWLVSFTYHSVFKVHPCCRMYQYFIPFLKNKIFYLLTFREKGWEGEREGEKHQHVRYTSIGCLSHTPNWGPDPQPRHGPWPGIKLAKPETFWFVGRHSTHWSHTSHSSFLSMNE